MLGLFKDIPGRGAGTGGAIAPPIFLEIGEIVAFSTPNILVLPAPMENLFRGKFQSPF